MDKISFEFLTLFLDVETKIKLTNTSCAIYVKLIKQFPGIRFNMVSNDIPSYYIRIFCILDSVFY